MKTIAVITGASSGMGRRFAETIAEFEVPVDEVWVIARRKERLETLTAPCPVRPIAMDLTDRKSFAEYAALLEAEQPNVALLINASGYGKFGATTDCTLDENLNMVDLNCQALMAMCQLTVPYMRAGSHIVNIASVAATQPTPYLNVYAATKAFVLYFSRGLNRELKKQGITVTAVCPYWTKTEFFDRAIRKKGELVVKQYIVMYTPDQIVRRTWQDIAKKRDVSMFGVISKGQTLLVKLLPQSAVMSIWQKWQQLD